MKIITFYLPQFHAIAENDEWWGKGFTEWVNVKRAQPLFENHYQPRIPKDQNYYNLLDTEVMRWQVGLARDHGVYGFCFYHYWFDGHMLLEKPVEQYLADPTLDLPFCICWANEHWTKAWESKSNQILIRQRYGGRTEWEAHFNYLLPFLQDSRYIKNDGKPLVVLYRPDLIECLNDMLDCWQEMAKAAGLPGLDFAYQQIHLEVSGGDDSRFAYNIEYQPAYANYDLNKDRHRFLKAVKRRLTRLLDRVGINLEQVRPQGLIRQDYDTMWKAVLAHRPKDEKCVPGAFVDWDNTPRKGDKGSVFVGASPEKFRAYLTQQILRARNVYHKDMLFLFAWNEWAEGGYLEPDERFGTGYLQAIKKALKDAGELYE